MNSRVLACAVGAVAIGGCGGGDDEAKAPAPPSGPPELRVRLEVRPEGSGTWANAAKIPAGAPVEARVHLFNAGGHSDGSPVVRLRAAPGLGDFYDLRKLTVGRPANAEPLQGDVDGRGVELVPVPAQASLHVLATSRVRRGATGTLRLVATAAVDGRTAQDAASVRVR